MEMFNYFTKSFVKKKWLVLSLAYHLINLSFTLNFFVLGFCFVFTSDGGNGRCICMRIYTRMDGMKVWVIAKLSMSLGTVYVLEYIYG